MARAAFALLVPALAREATDDSEESLQVRVRVHHVICFGMFALVVVVVSDPHGPTGVSPHQFDPPREAGS
jgi:hypothetical protein